MKPFRPYIVLQGLLAALGSGLAMFAMVRLDAFEALHAVSRRYEDWQLDDILLSIGVGVVFGASAVAVHLFRELARSRAEIARLKLTVTRLEARLQTPTVAGLGGPRHAKSGGRP